jgi:hypothetical protein
MNPARSFGPALASGEWTHFWIYVLGPAAGASIGALAYQLVRGEHPAPPIADGEKGVTRWTASP